MTPARHRLAALAAALVPDRAEALFTRFMGPGADRVARWAGALATRPRAARLAELEATLSGAARPHGLFLGPSAWFTERLACALRAAPSTSRTQVRSTDRSLAFARRDLQESRPLATGTVRDLASHMPFPFSLPALSRGFVDLHPDARAIGGAALARIAPALSEVLGTEVRIHARALDSVPASAMGVVRIALALEGVAATTVLEVDARLVARALERLGGTTPLTPAALIPSAAEQTLLELLALLALQAAHAPELDMLVPRLLTDASTPADIHSLNVALDVEVGDDRGRGRLLVPSAALRALAPKAMVRRSPVNELSLLASYRRGTITLTREELAASTPGDVLLLDVPPEHFHTRTELVFPGGLALRGPLEDEQFTIEEILMTETEAAYPITLSVEIARVPVRLRDLAELEPGVILPLQVPSEGTVVLRAGECAIARGQLVDVSGALGVRLAQVGERP